MMQNICDAPPAKKKTPQPGSRNLRAGVPPSCSASPPSPPGSNAKQEGDPRIHPAAPPTLHCTGRTSLLGCPQAWGSFEGGVCSFHLLFGGPRRLLAKGVSCN